MTLKDANAYLNAPLFTEAMGQFQAGKFQDGMTQLGEVEKQYPLETELRSLRQEMQLRARMDEYEIEEDKKHKLSILLKIGLRLALLVLVVGLAYWTASTYSSYLQQAWESTQQQYELSLQEAELLISYRNAQQYLQAGQTAEALELLQEISTINPNYPGLAEAMTQVETLMDIEAQYAEATRLLEEGDTAGALAILHSIDTRSPNYRDVALQIEAIQGQVELESVLAQADQAYDEGRWQDAVAGYETLRYLDITYQQEHVEELLYHSYILAAQIVLAEPVPTLQALQIAEDYFSNALSLRPQDRDTLIARATVRATIEDRLVTSYVEQAQAALVSSADSLQAQQDAEYYFGLALELHPDDPEILVQFQLAELYLGAIDAFNRGAWTATIDALEFVVAQDGMYANGTAWQTLYEAHIFRGYTNLAAGNYEGALEDFQRAAALAQQVPEAISVYFEAQIMIAETQGLLGNYYEAVLIYQAALLVANLREAIITSEGTLAQTLENAEYYANLGNYQASFQQYRELMRGRTAAYDNTNVVTVKSGDYWTMLAHQYNTTVSAILAANGLTSTSRLTPDMQLIIPTLWTP